MEYNTQKKKLLLPEYGRNIQKMVDYLLTIEPGRKNQSRKDSNRRDGKSLSSLTGRSRFPA